MAEVWGTNFVPQFFRWFDKARKCSRSFIALS